MWGGGGEQERRGKLLQLTDEAAPAARRVRQIHQDFYETVSQGMGPEDLEAVEQALRHMSDNINQKVWHRMEVHHGK